MISLIVIRHNVADRTGHCILLYMLLMIPLYKIPGTVCTSHIIIMFQNTFIFIMDPSELPFIFSTADIDAVCQERCCRPSFHEEQFQKRCAHLILRKILCINIIIFKIRYSISQDCPSLTILTEAYCLVGCDIIFLPAVSDPSPLSCRIPERSVTTNLLIMDIVCRLRSGSHSFWRFSRILSRSDLAPVRRLRPALRGLIII